MPKKRLGSISFALLGLAGLACQTQAGKGAEAEPAVEPPVEPQKPAVSPVSPGAEPAAVGKPAPDFALLDLDGRTVRLSEHKGKIVVLEWFNPECPYVKAAHTKGSLVGQAKTLGADGVVWLAVNSGAPGKQGAGIEKSRAGKQSFGLDHPILIDESGAVGKLYGAKRTPHLYVIDAEGVLVYRGAVDNSPDGEGASPKGGTLVRYVPQAIEAVRAKKPVEVAETEAYGCSVKYGN